MTEDSPFARRKRAVLAVFCDSQQPLTPLEIHERAGIWMPSISLAEVHRLLRFLIHVGKLRRVLWSGTISRYRLVKERPKGNFYCWEQGKWGPTGNGNCIS